MYFCSRCQSEVLVPEELLDASKERLSELRKQFPLVLIQWLQEEVGLSSQQVKGCVVHCAQENHQCHRCSYSFVETGVEHCPQCKALNINF